MKITNLLRIHYLYHELAMNPHFTFSADLYWLCISCHWVLVDVQDKNGCEKWRDGETWRPWKINAQNWSFLFTLFGKSLHFLGLGMLRSVFFNWMISALSFSGLELGIDKRTFASCSWWSLVSRETIDFSGNGQSRDDDVIKNFPCIFPISWIFYLMN